MRKEMTGDAAWEDGGLCCTDDRTRLAELYTIPVAAASSARAGLTSVHLMAALLHTELEPGAIIVAPGRSNHPSRADVGVEAPSRQRLTNLLDAEVHRVLDRDRLDRRNLGRRRRGR